MRQVEVGGVLLCCAHSPRTWLPNLLRCRASPAVGDHGAACKSNQQLMGGAGGVGHLVMHSRLLRCAAAELLALLCSQVTIQRLIGEGLDPQLENNPYLCFVYTSFQVCVLGGGGGGEAGGKGGSTHLAGPSCGCFAWARPPHRSHLAGVSWGCTATSTVSPTAAAAAALCPQPAWASQPGACLPLHRAGARHQD
jgi:hypothetical protein